MRFHINFSPTTGSKPNMDISIVGAVGETVEAQQWVRVIGDRHLNLY